MQTQPAPLATRVELNAENIPLLCILGTVSVPDLMGLQALKLQALLVLPSRQDQLSPAQHSFLGLCQTSGYLHTWCQLRCWTMQNAVTHNNDKQGSHGMAWLIKCHHVVCTLQLMRKA